MDDLPAGGAGRIEATAALVALALLLLGCFLVLQPFISPILWAGLLCFSTWEPYRRLKYLLGGRKSLAALVMTLLLAAVAVLPFVIVGEKLGDNVADVATAIGHAIENGPPHPPDWVAELPLVGGHLNGYLAQLANDPQARSAAIRDLVGPLRKYAIELGKSLGRGILEISLSLLICFFLYADGDTLAARLDRIVFRIAGVRGRRLLELAGLTVRGVVHGIIGTSLLQGVLGGVGFWIAGVPGAFILGFATFLFAFIPIAPTLLWAPAAVWLLEQDATRSAIFLVVWSIVLGSLIEHVLKPIIVSRTGATPVILAMIGAFGGALAFGFIGVFIGPTLLAVTYALIDEWSGRLAA